MYGVYDVYICNMLGRLERPKDMTTHSYHIKGWENLKEHI